MKQSLNQLVACVTSNPILVDRIESVAKSIGSDFYAADQLSEVLEECGDRMSLCVVADQETAFQPVLEVPVRWSHRIPTLVSVPNGDMQAAFRAATIGAVGFFDDQSSCEEISCCIQDAFESESQARKSSRFDHAVYREFKDREKAILAHLLAGESNKRVAAILDIGLRTVEAGRAGLMKKLYVKSFAELISFVATIEQERFLIRRRIYNSLRAGNRTTLRSAELY